MKWVILIGLPLAMSAIVTLFACGWTDIAASAKTFLVCFFFLGGVEAIGFAIKWKYEE